MCWVGARPVGDGPAYGDGGPEAALDVAFGRREAGGRLHWPVVSG